MSAQQDNAPLTRDEKEHAFFIATRFFDEHYFENKRCGLSDEELTQALQKGLSVRRSWGGPGRFSGTCDPNGLKIYAGRCPLTVGSKPIFEGSVTLAMARALYDIADPNEAQQSLF